MAAVLAVGLTAVKPVFAFTFLLLAWCYWRKRWPDSRWRRPVAVGLIAGTPLAAAVALWALFPGVAYLTMLWRPVLAGVAVDTILPAHRETWRGPRGHEMEIDYARVREHARSPEHVVVWASPAGRGDGGRMPQGELEAAKRHVMAVMWKRAPGTHARLAASLYVRALCGAGAASHANYMIGEKARLMRSPDFTTAHYRATELMALPTADRLGGRFLEFVEQPANWFFALHRGSEAAMSVVPWGIGLALAALGFAGRRRGASDRDGPMAGAARRAALMWCHLYAVALAVAAQVLTDRYVVLPVLLLGGVLVGWVEAWSRQPDSAAQGGPPQGKGGAEGSSKEDASG
jgi:hypothetical protein